MNIFSINVWKYFLISSNGFQTATFERNFVYLQHTVGLRGHALLWSGLCVGYGKVYNKCTMTWLFKSKMKKQVFIIYSNSVIVCEYNLN